MSMYVEKKDVSSVKNKLAELKRRKEAQNEKKKHKRQKTHEQTLEYYEIASIYFSI